MSSLCSKILFHSDIAGIGNTVWLGTGSDRCEDRLSLWWSWWGNLYDLVGGI